MGRQATQQDRVASEESGLAHFLPSEITAWLPGQPSGFAWRPGSDEITVVLHTWQYRDCGRESAELWRLDVTTGQACRYWPMDARWFDSFPCWSHDGACLYFLRRFTLDAHGSPASYWAPYRYDAIRGKLRRLSDQNFTCSGIEGDEPLPLSVVFMPERNVLFFVARHDTPTAEYQFFCYDYQRRQLTTHSQLLSLLREEVEAKMAESLPTSLSRVLMSSSGGEPQVDTAEAGTATWILAAADGTALALTPQQDCVRLFGPVAGLDHPMQRPCTRQISYVQWVADEPDTAVLRLYDASSGGDCLVLPPSDGAFVRVAQPPWPTYSWEAPYAWSPDGSRVVFCVYGQVYVLETPL